MSLPKTAAPQQTANLLRGFNTKLQKYYPVFERIVQEVKPYIYGFIIGSFISAGMAIVDLAYGAARTYRAGLACQASLPVGQEVLK
jgi:hypothetical protein